MPSMTTDDAVRPAPTEIDLAKALAQLSMRVVDYFGFEPVDGTVMDADRELQLMGYAGLQLVGRHGAA